MHEPRRMLPPLEGRLGSTSAGNAKLAVVGRAFFVGPSIVGLALAACGGETIGHTRTVDHVPPTTLDGGRSEGGTSDGGAESEASIPNDEDALKPRDGSRLQILWPYYFGGPRLWDGEKGIECAPRPAADGKVHCMPVPTVGGALLFTDSTCKHAVIQHDAQIQCGSAPYYADADEAGQCPTHQTRVYSAGSPIDAPSEVYPHNANPCSLLDRTATISGTPSFFEAVPSDASEWTLLTEEVVPVTDSLAVAVWTGSDGSRMPYELRLRSNGAPCDQYSSPDQSTTYWCVPKLRAHPGDGFPDDQCTGQPLAGACGKTDIIEFISDGVLSETGKVVSPVFFKNPNESGKCMTLNPAFTSVPNPSVFYTTGQPLNPNRYPPLVMASGGSGRIRLQYMTSEGKNLFVESYYDAELGQQCTPTRLSDGGAWCVAGGFEFRPENPAYYFGDSACTRELTVASSPLVEPGVPNYRYALVYQPNSACNPKAFPEIHSIIVYSGPLFQKVSEAACVPVPPSDLQGLRFYEPGPPIDPASVLAQVPQ